MRWCLPPTDSPLLSGVIDGPGGERRRAHGIGADDEGWLIQIAGKNLVIAMRADIADRE